MRKVFKYSLLCLIFTVFACGAFAQRAPKQKLPENNGSTIRGRVLYADTGRPLRGAAIVVVGMSRDVDEVMTDRRGEFTIPKLEAGTYLLGVEAPGIVSWDDFFFTPGVPMVDAIAEGRGRDLFTEVSVNGTTDSEVQIKARRGGVITGRVMLEDDQALAGAEIQLFRRFNKDLIPVRSTWEGSIERRPQTDSRGQYRIAGLLTGDYIVRVSEGSFGSDGRAVDPDTFANGSFMVAYHPAATTLKSAQSVAVVEGSEVADVDIRMPERVSHTISGTVTVGPDDEPGAFVGIRIDRLDEKRPTAPSIGGATTRSDSEGKWEVNGIPDGEYQIIAGGDVRVGPRNEFDTISVVTTRLTARVAGDDVSLNIKLSPGAVVAGTVVADGDWLKKYSVQVTLRRADDQKSAPANGAVVWDNGREWKYMYVNNAAFGSSGFSAGRYWLNMEGLDPDRAYVKSVVRNNVDLMRTPLTLTENDNCSGIKITLAADMATVQGRVLQASDRKQTLEILLVMVDPVMRRFGEAVRTVKTEADGSFKIKLGPGEYVISALDQSQIARLPKSDAEAAIKLVGTAGQRIKVRAGETLKDLKVSAPLR